MSREQNLALQLLRKLRAFRKMDTLDLEGVGKILERQGILFNSKAVFIMWKKLILKPVPMQP